MNKEEKADLWNSVLAWQSQGYSKKEVGAKLKYLGHAAETIATYYDAVAVDLEVTL